jgi:hypothetical protein
MIDKKGQIDQNILYKKVKIHWNILVLIFNYVYNKL